MYVILICASAGSTGSGFHAVNDNGKREHSTRTMQELLRWLVDAGEVSVVAITDDGPELFLIEPCEGLQMHLPAISLRRKHIGRCADLPPLPGIADDPTLRARVLDNLGEDSVARTKRRNKWLRRATYRPGNDIPG